MKKILTITSFALISQLVLGQGEENELKNFRFGLKVMPSVNWYKPEGKIISGNGAGMKFGGGLILEFRLAKVASIQTGLEITMDGGKVKYNNGGQTTPNANTVSYNYNTADDEIVEYDSRPDGASSLDFYTRHKEYQLNERQYKATYITIPLALKLKTKEIGALTYFGQFGLNSSIRWKAKATDKVTVMQPTQGGNETKENVDITRDVNFFNSALNFGAGVEYNISGSTSLLIGLNYNLGFTNVVKSESRYLIKRTNDPNYNTITNPTGYTTNQLSQSMKSNAVVLTIGVLF